MLAPEGRPATSPAARPRSGSHVHSSSSSGGSGSGCDSSSRSLRGLAQYATAVLRYVFRRASRSGPRLLLYLAAFLTAVLVMTGLLSRGLAEPVAGRVWLARLSAFFGQLGAAAAATTERPRPPQEAANAHDAVVGGGLRVVVFGENDVATSRLQNVAVDARALGDNNSTSWTEALCVELRCTSYQSFVPALDLPRRSLSNNALYADAVNEVLASATGALPANDFSHVAKAYPVPVQVPDLRAQVDAFLAQPPPQRPPKETVWVVSFGQWDVWSLAAFPAKPAENVVVDMVGALVDSIDTLYRAAHHAGSVAASDRSAAPREEAVPPAAGAAGAALLPWNSTTAAPFRVLVPLLVDPSVLPGWRLERPAAPPLHTKPEQVRRAVRLTQLWNERVAGELAAWVARSGNDTVLQPDATLFPLPDYVMDAMIDSQMKGAGLTDRRKFGKLPKAEAYANVDAPCLATATPSSTPLPFTLEMHPAEGKDKSSLPKSKPDVKEAPATAGSGGMAVCTAPDRHLFFTAFSLGQRGIAEIGRQGAALVRADAAVRGAWAAARAKKGNDREPASWKEYELL